MSPRCAILDHAPGGGCGSLSGSSGPGPGADRSGASIELSGDWRELEGLVGDREESCSFRSSRLLPSGKSLHRLRIHQGRLPLTLTNRQPGPRRFCPWGL